MKVLKYVGRNGFKILKDDPRMLTGTIIGPDHIYYKFTGDLALRGDFEWVEIEENQDG